MNDVLKRNNVQVIGNGTETILLAHGFGCDQESWYYILDDLKENYQIILFDFVGAGKSDITSYSSTKYNSLSGYAQDVLDVCEALKLKEIVYVGHSVSSMIGVLAALERPGLFKKMVFIGPSAKYINEEGYKGGFEKKDLESLFEFMENNYLGWSDSLGPAIMGNADRPELGAILTKSFNASNPDIIREFAKVTFFSDNREDLKRLTVPSLTIQCADDIIAPIYMGTYINEITPQNTLVHLDAIGHCPHISEPKKTVEVIKQFIN